MSMKKTWMFILGGFVVAGLATAPSLYFYQKYQQALGASQPREADEVKVIIEKVGALILLPEGETPTVMTVTEKERLTKQEFFAHAKNGDKVLIYNGAKKAFLYDPVANKILEVGPVLGPTPTVASLAGASVPLGVVLYNGTTTLGLTKKIEATLASDAHYKVVDKDTAKNTEYKTTQVIDVSGNNGADAEVLAQKLGASVGTLPSGETKPINAVLLVIIGADKE